MSLRVAVLAPTDDSDDARMGRALVSGLRAAGHDAGLTRRTGLAEGQLAHRGFERGATGVALDQLALRLERADVSHACDVAGGAAAARWTGATGRPSVLAHSGMFDRPWLTARRMRMKLSLEGTRGCSAVVCPSQAAAAALRRSLGTEARVVAPAVDLERFTAAGARDQQPSILALGEDDRLLHAAVERVRRQRPDARLKPAGTAAPEDYQAAWVAVAPAPGEASGLGLLEALACGTPVVGAAGGAAPEIIRGDALGATFDGTEEGLGKALLLALDLAESPASADACRARAEEYSSASRARKLTSLYQELLG